MNLNKIGDLDSKMDEKKRAYYSLSDDIYAIKCKLINLNGRRGHSDEFKLLDIALDKFDRKLKDDFNRFERRVKKIKEKSELEEMQKALNRERKLRADLEDKIKEASISGGLFIKYVRNKMGV